jgi:chromate transporter
MSVEKEHGVPFSEAMKVWLRVAALSFGGPAGQIAVMHRIIVEEKKWIGEQRFLQALNYCTLLPGPEAQQLATYIGWLMHRTKGGLVAGTLFVLPGLIAIMALSWIYVLLGNVTLVQGLFFGLKAAVLVIVVEAVLRIGRRALRSNTMRALAAAAFVAIFFYAVPFPIIIVVAGLIGFVGAHLGWAPFLAGGNHGKVGERRVADTESLLGEETPAHARPNLRWSLSIGALFLALWLVPVALLWFGRGSEDVFAQIALFFSKMAVVTFGGAYAVLAYVAQQAVDNYGWVTAGEMLDGLGMAESTPGPLIMVTQFVGFLGAWRDPGELNSLLAGTLGGLLTTWVTFTPCFLWIFVGAPFVEALRSNKALSGALAAVTAAVVGVILNLAVWFGLQVLFAELNQVNILGATFDVPEPGSANVATLALVVACAIAIFRFRFGMISVLLASSFAGVVYSQVVSMS